MYLGLRGQFNLPWFAFVMFAPPGFEIKSEKKPKRNSFFFDLYEDPFKWFARHIYLICSRSLIKSVGLYGFAIFGFFVINAGVNAPPEIV